MIWQWCGMNLFFILWLNIFFVRLFHFLFVCLIYSLLFVCLNLWAYTSLLFVCLNLWAYTSLFTFLKFILNVYLIMIVYWIFTSWKILNFYQVFFGIFCLVWSTWDFKVAHSRHMICSGHLHEGTLIQCKFIQFTKELPKGGSLLNVLALQNQF